MGEFSPINVDDGDRIYDLMQRWGLELALITMNIAPLKKSKYPSLTITWPIVAALKVIRHSSFINMQSSIKLSFPLNDLNKPKIFNLGSYSE